MLLGLGSRSPFLWISDSKFRGLGLLNLGFRGEFIAAIIFHRSMFYELWNPLVLFFGRPWEPFFCFLCLGSRLGKIWIFDGTQISRSEGGGANLPPI